jgi:hypothetical protein
MTSTSVRLGGKRSVFYSVLGRAILRGEVSSEMDGDLLSDVLFGPIVLRLITGVRDIDNKMIYHVLPMAYRGISSK